MTTVVGVDGSLSCTGVAALWSPLPGHAFTAVRSETTPADLDSRLGRIDKLCAAVGTVVRGYRPVLIVYEGPAHAAKGQGEHFLGGYWWSLARVLRGIAPVAVVAPATVKHFASGDGSKRTTKREMVAAARLAFPDRKWLMKDNDLADAGALAALGAMWLGLECGGVFSPSGWDSVDHVRWPELEGEDHARTA